MDQDGGNTRDFLNELYRLTDGELEKQVTMQEVGDVMGLAKEEASALAEELIVGELVELKTLAGAIAITADGVEFLREKGDVAGAVGKVKRLSGGAYLTEADRTVVHDFLAYVRTVVVRGGKSAGKLEEAVIDLKTIEVQMLSPAPKTAVIRAVARSLLEALYALNGSVVPAEFADLYSEEKNS